MTKSNKFKAAHALAKTFTGNYKACFSAALIHVNAILKLSGIAKDTYIAQNITGNVDKIAETKLSFFRASVESNKITLVKNTYEVKETLKEIGFKFNSIARTWTKSCVTANEVLEIANKLAA